MPTWLAALIVAAIGFVGILFGHFATLYTSQKSIEAKHITGERRRWRDYIRKLAPKIFAAYKGGNKEELTRFYIEMQIRLNPIDENDVFILDTIWKMIKQSEPGLDIELSEKLSLLLKQDWERVKNETKFFWQRLFLNLCCSYRKKRKRVSYEEFKFKRLERDT